MSRSVTQLLNGGIGFVLGYVVGAWLRGRRTGLVVGLIAAVVLALAGGSMYDRLDEGELPEDVADVEPVESVSA